MSPARTVAPALLTAAAASLSAPILALAAGCLLAVELTVDANRKRQK